MFRKIIFFLVVALLLVSKNLILTNYNQIGPKLFFAQTEPKNGDTIPHNNPKEILQTFGEPSSPISLDKIISSSSSLGSNSPSNQGSPSFGNKK